MCPPTPINSMTEKKLTHNTCQTKVPLIGSGAREVEGEAPVESARGGPNVV